MKGNKRRHEVSRKKGKAKKLDPIKKIEAKKCHAFFLSLLAKSAENKKEKKTDAE